jgi:diphosphomevalonate decarboxylase
MNLDSLFTRTTVTFDPDLAADQVTLDDKVVSGGALDRISGHLDHFRKLAGITTHARVDSTNNFPAGAGIASSASGFAALTVAAAGALGLDLSERALSSFARLGSGSASRSVPAGFVEWYVGDTHEASYAETIAPADHWNLRDLVTIISKGHKTTGSTEGHALAGTSILQTARVAHAPERIAACRSAILDRDFPAFAEVVEMDSNIMHAVMMTSHPPLFYWAPETLAIMAAVRAWRAEGLRVCYTIDAGANVHCICIADDEAEVLRRLHTIAGVIEIRTAGPGRGASFES